MKYYCETCGKEHEGLPLDIAYRLPPSVLRIPASERRERVELTSDFCVIDGEIFIIRGVLEMSVQGLNDSFRWGCWAITDEQSFARYIELWDAENVEDEPPFTGYLDGGLRDYENSDQLEVEVILQSAEQRPRFVVADEVHPIAQAQRYGITMKDVHHFVRDLL